MKRTIAHLALVVDSYDDAVQFYTTKLDFQLIEDTKLSEEKRWVIVAPPGAKECSLLLARASGEEQRSRIGNQTGGRVFLFLFTDDIERDYKLFRERGVKFVRELSHQSHGTVAVFEDLYGNLWDLIQPAPK